MIKIVTDSVTSIPPDMLEAKPIQIATLYVNRDGEEYVDQTMDVDAFYSEIYEMADNIPTSSQPSQKYLEESFEKIAKDGDELLGIFLSSGLSGTIEGALRAARAVKERIPSFSFALIDSCSCGFDEAFPVLDAAEFAQTDMSLSECAKKTVERIMATRFLFTPENLTFLHKGGRIGSAATLVGNLVKLSPILTVVEGKVETVAKIRHRKKALERIVTEFKSDIESYGFKHIVVHYIGDKTPALEWAKNTIEPLVERSVRVIPVSPVIGVHVGPAVGISYECERPMPHKFPNNPPQIIYTQ
ncbi:MAG: DegV family protein [Raoultibacter sp.]